MVAPGLLRSASAERLHVGDHAIARLERGPCRDTLDGQRQDGQGQSVRIVLNLDFVNNDGPTFAPALRAEIELDRRRPTAEQESRGLKEIVVGKGRTSSAYSHEPSPEPTTGCECSIGSASPRAPT